MYADYATFGKSMDKWMSKFQDRNERLIRGVATELARNIIVGGKYSPGSPVDTGFFRSLWKASINVEPQDSAVQHPKDHGEAVAFTAFDEVMTLLSQLKPGDMLWLSNAAIYGPALEYGHSQQAPMGFVRITLAAFEQIVYEEVMKLGPIK